jgi:hypothetical protein
MKSKKFKYNYLLILLLYALMIFLIMILWNVIIPNITGWKSINFWQALGLTVLLRLLCGNLHHANNNFHTHSHYRSRGSMRGMSHKDREEFIRRRFQNLMKDEPNWEK